MTKKVLGFAALVLVCSTFIGCTSVQNYSLRSYQGPLPMNDYRYVNPDAYGTPVTPR